MPSHVSYVFWSFSLASYVVGTFCIIFLLRREWSKRKEIEILSWKGHSRGVSNATSRFGSNKDDTATASNNGSTGTASRTTTTNKAHSKRSISKEFLAGSLHYSSICVYIFSFLTCLVGIFRCIPNLCFYHIMSVFFGCIVFSKFAIIFFQWNRYILCFINDQKHYQTSQSGICMRLCFYICLILTFFGCVFSIWTMIDFWLSKSYLFDDIWCNFEMKENYLLSMIIGAFSFLFTDWPILVLYIATILHLSNQLKRSLTRTNLNNAKDSKNTNSKNRIGIDRANKKLQKILKKILICSLTMEATFLIATIIDVMDGKFTCLPHIALVIDAISNVYFTNLMLEHNRNQYDSFIHISSKFFACICKCCYNKKVESNNRNEMESNRNSNNSPQKTVGFVIKAASKHPNLNETNTDFRGISVDPTHGSIMSSDNNDEDGAIKPMETNFGVEQSYYTSQISRKETRIPDPL